MLFTDGNVLVFTKTFDWEHIWWTFLTRIYRLQLDGDGTWDMLWAIPEDNARGVLRRVIPSVPASSTAQPDQSSGDGPVFIGDAMDDEYPDAGYVAIIPPFDEDVITLDLTADDVHTVQGTQHSLANAVLPTGSGIGHETGDAPGGFQPSDVARQAQSQTQQQPSLSTEPQASAPADPSAGAENPRDGQGLLDWTVSSTSR
ncbi:hypothetical protein FOZ63_017651 [Perkinsus olseni]|uniref:Uncharacterized protein n=1 Tax=Perkinsus olseni TaxID=32597 RepID=A0A7J6PX89_PEROL|nr:hypothetical protein FOZ63_017651 [Perkinsus olseni]